jgi:hypothetical protein
MKATFSILTLLLVSGGSLRAASDAPAKGAKEIFYNPMDGSVVSAPQPSFFKAPAAPTSIPLKGLAAGPKNKGTAAVGISHKAKPDASQGRRSILKPSEGMTLGLSYWIELVGPEGQGRQVTDDRIFRSGDKIRLHFRSNADGNIALIQLGSSGTSSFLFPDRAKGLDDSRIHAADDRILPTESAWFRFDNQPGTEKVLVIFAKSQQEIDTFSFQPSMDVTATHAAMRKIERAQGEKDLILETETQNAAEIGGYGVNLAGKPVVMEIELRHQ